jgi:hypothetical protein
MEHSSGTTSIAITGASALCSLGTDRRAALASMLEGKTGFVAGDGLESRPEENPGVGQAVDLDPPVRYSMRCVMPVWAIPPPNEPRWCWERPWVGFDTSGKA